MTRSEAVTILRNEQPHCGDKIAFSEAEKYEALNMAIQALEQEPNCGKWRKRKIKEHQFMQNGYELYYCSECDKNYSNTVGIEGFDYCPNCGARMESDER